MCIRDSLGGVNIAAEHQHDIARRIMVAEPRAHIAKAGRIEIGHRADGLVAIGVADGEQPFRQRIAGQRIGLSLIHI